MGRPLGGPKKWIILKYSALKISNDDKLPLFFDKKLVLVPTSVKYGDQYDDDGEFVESKLKNKYCFSYSSGFKPPTFTSDCLSNNDGRL